MKKNTLILLAILLSFGASAQLHLGLSASYASPLNGTTLDEIGMYDLSYTVFAATLTENQASFGGGMQLCGSIGYVFHPNVGFELEGSYHLPQVITSRYSAIDDYLDDELSTKAFSIRPSLVFTISKGEKRTWFTSMGLIYTRASFVKSRQGILGGETQATRWEFSSSMGLGLRSSLGVQHSLSRSIKLRTELFFDNISVAPTSAFLTEYKVQGISYLDTLSTYDRQIIYDKEVIVTSQTSINEPKEELKFKIPFNNVGLKLSLRILLH